ncbi:MAG: Hsp20/alpha crystallin family protein [Eubacteriales bacterium]|nr:Hsp20/alpha crystallin family protein [Eubacteriales bacterium]
MLLPSMFTESLFDDFFTSPHYKRSYSSNVHEMMKTDIKDQGNVYEMTMSLPGVRKEDVKAELKDGYLTIQATSNSENNESADDGKYIRRERYMGTCSRSFYVGDEVKQEDIKAKFEDGTLHLTIPKKEEVVVDNKNYITIEG